MKDGDRMLIINDVTKFFGTYDIAQMFSGCVSPKTLAP